MKKIYVVTTQSVFDYDASVISLKHGAFVDPQNALNRLIEVVAEFKTMPIRLFMLTNSMVLLWKLKILKTAFGLVISVFRMTISAIAFALTSLKLKTRRSKNENNYY